ncbi:hypothetical protein BSPWISOXPB_7946, partial [uncultured Gammaproteobacteria bacterium]
MKLGLGNKVLTRIWAEKGTRPRQFVSSNLNTDIFLVLYV